MSLISGLMQEIPVTPYEGVWIEIDKTGGLTKEGNASLPMRECGLKCESFDLVKYPAGSLPMRECGLKSLTTSSVGSPSSHSLCGSVD